MLVLLQRAPPHGAPRDGELRAAADADRVWHRRAGEEFGEGVVELELDRLGGHGRHPWIELDRTADVPGASEVDVALGEDVRKLKVLEDGESIYRSCKVHS